MTTKILTMEDIKAIYSLNYSMGLGIIEIEHGIDDVALISYINCGVVHNPKKYKIYSNFDGDSYVLINDEQIYIDEFIRTDI